VEIALVFPEVSVFLGFFFLKVWLYFFWGDWGGFLGFGVWESFSERGGRVLQGKSRFEVVI
jgi:hypothetical protein